MSQRRRSWAARPVPRTRTAVLVLFLIAAGLVALSPMAMGWIAAGRTDWNTLSDVGQTYGLASAILSGFALVSIGLSLLQQAKQTKIAQVQAARAMQMELFTMAYEHPDLRTGWGATLDTSPAEWRQRTYINLVFMYIRTAYVIGDFGDDDLRRSMANRFRTELGRDFWRGAVESYRVGASGRRERNFLRITDAEYRQALTVPPIHDKPRDDMVDRPARKTPPATVAVAAVAVAAAVWAVAIRRTNRRSTS